MPGLRAALGASLVLGLLGSGLHTHLRKSAPAADELLSSAPGEVRLWFSEQPELRLTSIRLLRSDSSTIAIGAVTATDDPTSVAAPVTTRLPAGKYIVVWRTASRDGHAVRGQFAFTVR